MKKICTKCKKGKPLIEGYYRNGKSSDGRASQCKKCTDVAVKEYVKNNRERTNRNALRRYHKNPEAAAARSRKYFYGITDFDYQKLLTIQKGVCAICKQVCSLRGKLSVDHCHWENRVRGLLCAACNAGIGLLKDSSDLCRKAARYLDTSKI